MPQSVYIGVGNYVYVYAPWHAHQVSVPQISQRALEPRTLWRGHPRDEGALGSGCRGGGCQTTCAIPPPTPKGEEWCPQPRSLHANPARRMGENKEGGGPPTDTARHNWARLETLTSGKYEQFDGTSDWIILIRFGKFDFREREVALIRFLGTISQSTFAAGGRGVCSAHESSGKRKLSSADAAGAVAATAGAGALAARAGAGAGGAAFAMLAAV